jgi:hypothetical protein
MDGGLTQASHAAELLLRYLQTEDEELSLTLEAQLLCHEAEPIIRSVLKQKLRAAAVRPEGNGSWPSLEDMYSAAVLEVLMRLRELRRNANSTAIENFQGYVAAITYRVWSECLRKNEPWRASLKKKLHYLLTRDPSFAIWKGADAQWSCGMGSWRDQAVPSTNARLRTLLEDPLKFDYGSPAAQESSSKQLIALVTAILNFVKSPMRFDDLVGTIVRLSGTNHRRINGDAFAQTGAGELTDSRATVADQVERRIFLEYVWTEIGKLPLRQRMALLLNLIDPGGNSVISLLPAIGIASLREIAASLGMSEEQLASIWNELPVDDRTIASYLGATRQQVINLRKTARERLARRSRAFRGEGEGRD